MGTAGRKKEQFMALVEPEQMRDLDALRVVMWVSRADVVRSILTRYLRVLKGEHREGLDRLTAVAERAGAKRNEFVTALVTGRQRTPSLEELEIMSDTQLRKLMESQP